MKAIKRFTVFDIKQDKSATSSSFKQPDKAGYLHTFTGSSFLGKEKWKRRYYVLTGSYLHRFKKLEDAISERYSDRRISLEKYDICQRDDKNTYNKDFVFILDGAFGDNQQQKYVFAAENNADMQDWISQVRRTLVRIQQNINNAKPKRPPRTKVASSSSSSTVAEPASECHDGGSVGDSSSSRLYNPTKFRVRGPKGRRLPQKKNRLKNDADKYRSNSLCEFEVSDESIDENQTEPKDEVDGNRKSVTSYKNKAKSNSSDNLAYRYSSSDDSLNVWDSNTQPKEQKTTIDDKVKQENHQAADDVNVKETPKLQLDVSQKQSESTSTKTPQSPSGNATGPLIFTSAKLLEVSASLNRMKKQMKDDFDGVSTNLLVIKKKLLEFPNDYALIDSLAAQIKLAIAVLYTVYTNLNFLITISLLKLLNATDLVWSNKIKQLFYYG
ncbi:hypothetical protein CHUAL_000593 [Chamberlinius hualienensis]